MPDRTDRSDDLDERVSASRQISLSRDPRLSHDLAQYYPREETEQDIITQAMKDVANWGERGILPLDILEHAETFVELSSNDIDAEHIDDGIRLTSEKNQIELRIMIDDDAVEFDSNADE